MPTQTGEGELAVLIVRLGEHGDRQPVLATADRRVVDAVLDAVQRTLGREEADALSRDSFVA